MFLRISVLLVLTTFCLHAEVPVAGKNPADTRELSPVALRGYGTLAGTYRQWQLPGGAASILEIRCDDVAKARIVHAKYVSDLQLLPGIEIAPGGPPDGLQCFQAANRAWIAAVRSDKTVSVLNAGSRSDLTTLFANGLTGPKTALAYAPETEAPMFLDRWDKFGFRFYYRPWETPPKKAGEAIATPYDPAVEFDYAAEHDRIGFAFWNPPFSVDSAEGETNAHYWDWAQAEAKARKLPIAINCVLEQPTWLMNRFRGESMMRTPGYVGTFSGVMRSDRTAGSKGELSWNSVAGNDALLGTVQGAIRRFNADPNVVSWMEPHGELDHGDQDILVDFGPWSDASFRDYLKDKFKEVSVVSNRWYGDGRLKGWNQIEVPGLASFMGADERSIDLTGLWKVGYEAAPDGREYTKEELDKTPHTLAPVPTVPAPQEWFSAQFNDAKWPQVFAPSDEEMFLPQRPAVFRRTFDVSAAQKAKGRRWWLYIFDFNRLHVKGSMAACLNGAKVGESPYVWNDMHWAAFEVTPQLRMGRNQVSIRLPLGFMAYRVYLSPEPPKGYPNLGEGKNAMWADFSEWRRWSHWSVVKRGAEMIRQIDPNRNITYAHPDKYSDAIKKVAVDYGGEFHCTGYMSGFFAEMEPMIMRGAGMPASLEPGGPAHDLPGFKKQMGLNLTEGVQGIDYFLHIGDVLWYPDVRKHFEENFKVIKSVGKYHFPRAESAIFLSEQTLNLTGFPWKSEKDTILLSGYYYWNASAPLIETYPFDAVTESDFADGNVEKYKVVIDTNSCILDEQSIDQIERFVRDGGVFVTFAQTGRHTPVKKDAWPICRLTGYNVTHVDGLAPDGTPLESARITAAPGQSVFPAADWNSNIKANGLTMEKRQADCIDLLLWENGKVAAGMRPIGKGFIVQLGAKFRGVRFMDRWEGGPLASEDAEQAKLFDQLLKSFHVSRIPAHLSDPNSRVFFRHYVSNNGLDDIWMLYNRSEKETLTVSLTLDQEIKPARCIEVVNGSEVPLADDGGVKVIKDIRFEPLQTRMFITPRTHLETAALDWFDLQRNWWRGTHPVERPIAPFEPKLALDLDHDWAFHPVESDAEAQKMVAATCDDRSWEHRSLDVWTFPDHRNVKRAVLRKKFTVPSGWKNGRVELWSKSYFSRNFLDKGCIYLDGKLLSDSNLDGAAGNDAGGAFKAGTEHTLAVDISTTGVLAGCRGSTWLAYVPATPVFLDLAGAWVATDDCLNYNKTLTLPGAWTAAMARRTIRVDSKYAGKNAVVEFDGPGGVTGVIINGRYINHNPVGGQSLWRLNITPWVNFGGANELTLRNESGDQKEREPVKSVKLLFFDPAVYP